MNIGGRHASSMYRTGDTGAYSDARIKAQAIDLARRQPPIHIGKFLRGTA